MAYMTDEELFGEVDVTDLLAGNKWARNIPSHAQGYDRRQYHHWFNLLLNAALSSIEWEGLPAGIDARALEYNLLYFGMGAMFEESGGLLFAKASNQGYININYNPNKVLITSPAGDTWERFARTHVEETSAGPVVHRADCAVCFDSNARRPLVPDIKYYAKRLATIDRICDVNVEAQATPFIIAGRDSSEQNTKRIIAMLRAHNQYITVNADNPDFDTEIQVLQTAAPYVADKLADYKTHLVQEYLTAIGIDNDPNATKAERRTTSEILQNNEQVMIARRARMQPRLEFCERVREVFGIEIGVRWAASHEVENDLPAIADGPGNGLDVAGAKLANAYEGGEV